MLKEIKAEVEVIDVIVGRYDNGDWYATSDAIPWLAAEGDTASDVMQTIRRIAPALRGSLCPEIPFKLKWHMVDVTK